MKHGAIRSFYNHAPSHSIDCVSKSLKIKMANEVRVKATKKSLELKILSYIRLHTKLLILVSLLQQTDFL